MVIAAAIFFDGQVEPSLDVRCGMTLIELAPDVTVDEVLAKTAATVSVHPNLQTMSV